MKTRTHYRFTDPPGNPSVHLQGGEMSFSRFKAEVEYYADQYKGDHAAMQRAIGYNYSGLDLEWVFWLAKIQHNG